ncbi:putative Late nodulin [Medicago truncatula]|uniref:Nodule Cysteine-Rich (NCR) secreted peptide n=1 Tax=Medicago truncatula TaxID=3880 RepID=A0A072V8P6_MEDTR|nr:Nodule Cysteine-Rich (NCR) secreted peptide [Medicago truncatula]RHN68022.1 putative Late nodulin [Medicago truncatula]
MVQTVKFVCVIIIFISLFLAAMIVEGRVKYKEDYGGQNKWNEFPLKPHIRTYRIKCKDDSGCEGNNLCEGRWIPKCLKPYFLFLTTKEGFCACV